MPPTVTSTSHPVGYEILVKGDDPIAADIIFVHGLQGHRTKTWTKNDVCWPRDLLPKEAALSHVRVLAFGYNAKIVSFMNVTSPKTLFEHSRSLLSELALLRQGDLVKRPIIFVAHSLGGLLVKDALRLSHQSDTGSDCPSTFKATRGVIFFGTPHRGSSKIVWGSIVTAIANIFFANTNRNILRDLKQDSQTLERLEENFKLIVSKLMIYSFGEELPYRIFGKIVQDYSAKIGIANEEWETIYANHTEMVKFCSREDSEYKKAIFALQTLLTRRIKEPAVQKTPTETFDNTPPRTVNHFVQRRSLLNRLKELFERTPDTSSPLVVVLYGMGGIGKTQLALEYCQEIKKSGKARAIFWIDASSRNAIHHMMTIIAKWLLPNRKLDNAEVAVALVKDSLSRRNDDWLMVFDNLDNPSDLSEISSFLPNGGCGSILVTSRFAGTQELGRSIKVDCMDEPDGLQLLLGTHRTDEKDLTAARQILTLLGYLPLAIDQARAYISRRDLALGDFVREYEKRKETIFKETPPLWHYDGLVPGEDKKTPLGVSTTWEMSLSLLDSSTEHTAKLRDVLTVFAFFHSVRISERLFVGLYNGWSSPMSIFHENGKWDHLKYEAAVTKMQELSLLQFSRRNEDEIVVSLHPMISEWLRMTLDKDSRTTFLGSAILHLHGFMTLPDASDFKMREEALSHIHAMYHAKEFPVDNYLFYGAYLSFSSLYLEFMMYNEAEQLVKFALAGYEKSLTHNNTLTLSVVYTLANIYHEQRHLPEAEEMYRRALVGYENTFGPSNPSTLNVLHALTNLYIEQGRIVEAEEIFDRNLANYEKEYGPDHKETLKAFRTLANIYQKQGRREEAEKMLQQVLVKKPDIVSMFQALDNLWDLYLTQDRVSEAEEMLHQALDNYEGVLGSNHPSILDTIERLGFVYENQDRVSEAEEMYSRVLVLCEEVWGDNHKKTLEAVGKLGSFYNNEGRLAEAEEMYDRVLAGYEKILGPDHPSTLDAACKLGYLYKNQGRVGEAEEMYIRALAGYDRKFSDDDLSALKTVQMLGTIYMFQDRLKEAESMFDRALLGYEKVLGNDEMLTLHSVYSLGNLYADQGRLTEAEAKFDLALAGYEKAGDRRSTVNTIHCLRRLYSDQGRLADTEKMFKKELAEMAQVFGPYHPLTLDTTYSLGIFYRNQSRLSEAEKTFDVALARYKTAWGPDHVQMLNTVCALGDLYFKQHRLTEAERMFQEALTGFEKTLGPAHMWTLRVVRDFGTFYKEIGRSTEGENLLRRARIGLEEQMIIAQH